MQHSVPEPYTIADAMHDYMAWYSVESDSPKAIASTDSIVNAHILPTLGEILLHELTSDQIERWHQNMSAAPARLRTRKGAPQNFRPPAKDRETWRRRKATANRIMTVLKAALNRAYRAGKVESPNAWQRVAPHRRVELAKIRYLSKDECSRLLRAAEDDLRKLVSAGLLTGCRYGELAELKVDDFNPDTQTIVIRFSKSGKSRHIPLDDEGQTFFGAHTRGRPSSEMMFCRLDGGAWGSGAQSRPMLHACIRAGIHPRASFHVLRHTYASHLAMNSVPLPVIAAVLGHADTRTTEKHYAHLSPDHIAATLRTNAPRLGIVGKQFP